MEAMDARPVTLKNDANFRWLMRGGLVSNLGDQLTIVALPLLVLQLTGDPLALGTVLALMGLPRAVFLLFGGALVDRLSPVRVLMASKMVNSVLLAVLAVMAATGDIPVVLVNVLAFCLGMTQAFGIPAGTSILPAALPAALLEAANGALMGVRQVTMLAGPLLAALLVTTSRHGLALAFAVDCASFIFSAWTLARVTLAARAGVVHAPVLQAVGQGLRMVWDDVPMRLCFLYWALVSLCIGGVMQVALPLLATQMFHGGATLGVFLGANGAGMLLGMAGAALGGKRLNLVRFGSLILLLDGTAGLLVAPLGLFGHAWAVAALLLCLGTLSGFLQITVYTWIQRRVPLAMMGRVMSIFMCIVMGVAPLSSLGAGWLLTVVALPDLLLGGGVMLMLMAASAWLLTPMRHILLIEQRTAG
jgi:hypothetical protein